MIHRRQSTLLTAVATASLLLAACGPQRVQSPQVDAKAASLVVLLPDAGGTTAGRVTVSSNPAGNGSTVDLANARESTLVGLSRAPGKVTLISEADAQRQFGGLLASLPPAPQHFTLFFRFESDELTPESRALLPDILRAVKERPMPEVVVVGHTDTTGAPASNVDLGLKRASVVRGFLAESGLESAAIEIMSHGEAVLLVPTPDETYEPRNRRVEITIR